MKGVKGIVRRSAAAIPGIIGITTRSSMTPAIAGITGTTTRSSMAANTSKSSSICSIIVTER